MDYRAVGASGLLVSTLGLGTLTWGRDTDEEEARGQLRAFLDAGGTLVDTSPAFGDGAAEALLGSLLSSFFGDDAARSQLTICTRVGFLDNPSGPSYSVARAGIARSLDASLARLGIATVDIAVAGGPDGITPDEETALALAGLVMRGKARYIGVSGYAPWRVAAMQTLLRERHLPALTVVEEEYSLVERSVETAMLPMCEAMGIGLLATSALGRGVLTGKYRHAIPATSRAASDHLAAFVAPYLDEGPRRIVEAVAKAAEGLNWNPAEVALGWLLATPVSAALVGARTASQLTSLLGGNLAGGEELPDLVIEALNDIS
ncbi:aldo/keto reductase [Actinotignum sp. GS-2025b]|uniref:aldo/keto reductase n=1 Tax=Actinotignum sp. GS-2025b TaxID=3427275 RepID=UPI003F45A93B